MKQLYQLLTIFIITIFFVSCKKTGDSSPSQAVQIQIDSISLKTNTNAAVYVSIKGSLMQVTGRGVCWDLNINPTVGSNYKINTQTAPQFKDSIALSPATKYYIRAYVALGADTVYSDNSVVTSGDITLVFDKQYAGNDNSPYIMGVVGNETDGFMILSSLAQPYSLNYLMRLTKVDGNGNLVWTRDYNDGTSKEPRMIQQLPDGYLIGINFWKNASVTVVLRKVDLNGNILWDREYKKDIFQFIVQMPLRNNQFLMTIRAYSTPVTDDPARTVSLWDFAVDNSGNTVSEKPYLNFTQLDSSNINYKTIETSDQGFFNYCDLGIDEHNSDVEVFLFGPQNTFKWKRSFPTPNLEITTGGTTAANGNYVVAGYQYNLSFNASQGFLAEVSRADGRYVWQNFYNKTSISSFYVMADVVQHAGDYYTSSNAGSTMFISKLNNAGKTQWEYPIAPKSGYNGVWPGKMYVSTTGGIYLFGLRRNTSNGTNPPEIFLLKVRE